MSTDEYIAAAREFLRNEGEGCIVSMSHLINELSDQFGDWFRGDELLDLIETLGADPHIDQVPNTGAVEFAWNGAGR